MRVAADALLYHGGFAVLWQWSTKVTRHRETLQLEHLTVMLAALHLDEGLDEVSTRTVILLSTVLIHLRNV